MNIYRAPSLVISPKRKLYRRWGERGINDKVIYIHIYVISLYHSVSLSPSFLLSLSHTHTHAHIHTHTHAHTHTHTSITVSGREGYWDGKRCVCRADLKADVELD